MDNKCISKERGDNLLKCTNNRVLFLEIYRQLFINKRFIFFIFYQK